MAMVGTMARALVEDRGFEVFDAWSPTLHAAPEWFDTNPSIGRTEATKHLRDPQHIEALSDTITQLLINQLCNNVSSW